jgi:exodeoxyribonuclease VII small subunit
MTSGKNGKQPDYETLKSELDSLMLELQRDDVGIDEALKRYERGLVLIKQLDDYLQTAENTITELQAAFNASQP